MAASYETYARMKGWPVGFYLRSNGIVSLLGGIIAFACLVGTFFVNPWYSFFIILIVGIIAAQLLIRSFKIYSPILSAALMLIGTVGLIIQLAVARS